MWCVLTWGKSTCQGHCVESFAVKMVSKRRTQTHQRQPNNRVAFAPPHASKWFYQLPVRYLTYGFWLQLAWNAVTRLLKGESLIENAGQLRKLFYRWRCSREQYEVHRIKVTPLEYEPERQLLSDTGSGMLSESGCLDRTATPSLSLFWSNMLLVLIVKILMMKVSKPKCLIVLANRSGERSLSMIFIMQMPVLIHLWNVCSSKLWIEHHPQPEDGCFQDDS